MLIELRRALWEKLRGRRYGTSRGSIAEESMEKTRQNASGKGLVTIIGLTLIYFSEFTKRHSTNSAVHQISFNLYNEFLFPLAASMRYKNIRGGGGRSDNISNYQLTEKFKLSCVKYSVVIEMTKIYLPRNLFIA